MGKPFEYWEELQNQVINHKGKATEIERLIGEIADLKLKISSEKRASDDNENRHLTEISLLMSKVTFYESRVKEMNRLCDK